MQPGLLALQDRLQHVFSDPSLLQRATTHRSFSSDHNERLEFLGDAVLELSASRILYDAYPGLTEGQLTLLRAELVREESLAEIAQRFGMSAYIRLSVGEARSGGAEKPSILSDVMEAVLGAVFLDGGYEKAFSLVSRMLETRLPDAPEDALDPKTRLQEVLQKARGVSPEYQLIGQSGPAHLPVFRVAVYAGGEALGEGEGGTKRAAQQAAARMALTRFKNEM